MRRPIWGPLLLTLACGVAPRQLPIRIVDDPLVSPRRLLTVGATGELAERPRPHLDRTVTGTFSYGLTDRLELDDLASLRWAALDDAPVPVESARRPDAPARTGAVPQAPDAVLAVAPQAIDWLGVSGGLALHR